MPDAELSLPAGKAFLSTVSSCTMSYCKVPETCRCWVRGSEHCDPLPSWGEPNTSQLVCTGNGPCPITSLKVTRQTSNECLSHKLPTKLPYSGCSLLFVSGFPLPAHSSFLIFSLASQSSVSSVNTAVAPVPRSLSLPLLPASHRLPASSTTPEHILGFPLLLSVSAGQK